MKMTTLISKIIGVTGGMLLMLTTQSIYAQTDTTLTPAQAEQQAMDNFVNAPNGGTQKAIVAGAARAIYQFTKTDGSLATSSFNPTTLFVIPCIKVNDRLFLDFAAELDVDRTGAATANFDELVVYYKLNPYMQLIAGAFNPKFGMYQGVLDDFTNRFGTAVAPVGMGHGPSTQDGIGLQGGIQTGYSKIHYQVYIANGGQLDTTTGLVNYGNSINNNKKMTIGGELGWLPFSNSCLELTLAGTYKGSTGPIGSVYEKVSNHSLAFAANYYHLFSPLMIRFIGEYNYVQTQNINYHTTDSTISKSGLYTFDNKQNGWFAGLTFKLAGAKSHFVRNMELGGRLSQYTPPTAATWGGTPINQTTLSLTYWLNWDIPLTFEYDQLTQSGAPSRKVFSTIVFYRF